MIYREKQYSDTLCHFNPNHDPRTGRFAKGSILDRLERRHLENKVSKAAKKESKKAEKLERLKQQSENRAYSPFSTYERAERILGDEFRKKVRQQEFTLDKSIRNGAKAYERLSKYWATNELKPETVSNGERFIKRIRESMSKMEMSGLYKSLNKEYNTTMTVPINEDFIKRL